MNSRRMPQSLLARSVPTRRRPLAAACAAALLGLMLAGAAAAQEAPPQTPTPTDSKTAPVKKNAKTVDKNKKKYAAPEYRKIAYVRLEPQDIADPSSISDAQVKQDYEAHLKNYTTPEKRTIEQIVFKDEAAANAGLASIKGGATFDDVAKSQGKTEADTKLGTFAKSELPEQKIADALDKASDAGQQSGLLDILNGLDASDLAKAMNSLSGVSHASITSLSMQTSGQFGQAINGRMSSLRSGGSQTARPHREARVEADVLQPPCGVVTLDGGISEAQPPALRYDVSLHREPVIRVVAPREKHLAPEGPWWGSDTGRTATPSRSGSNRTLAPLGTPGSRPPMRGSRGA